MVFMIIMVQDCNAEKADITCIVPGQLVYTSRRTAIDQSLSDRWLQKLRISEHQYHWWIEPAETIGEPYGARSST